MRFSIVIPSYNGKSLLTKNLPSVMKAARNEEVIVVDDASTDGSVDLVKTDFPEVRLIALPTNRRYAAACNAGVKAAKGDVIVLLNSDVSPEPDILRPLEPHFRDPRVFAVSFLEKTNGETRGKSIGWFEKGLLRHSTAQDRLPGSTFWAFGGSAAYRRSKWLELGGMDELFRPAYWEDIDLSYRAWKRGWEVRFEPECCVHHEPESTNIKVFGPGRITRVAYKNQILFVWKNIHDRHLILKHLLWFPVLFLVAILKGNIAFVLGSLQAALQLPEALDKRMREKERTKLTDQVVLQRLR